MTGRQRMGRILRWLGGAWLIGVALFILMSYAAILYYDGLAKLQEIASPFNVVNFVVIVASLLPGIGLLKLAERLERQ